MEISKVMYVSMYFLHGNCQRTEEHNSIWIMMFDEDFKNFKEWLNRNRE